MEFECYSAATAVCGARHDFRVRGSAHTVRTAMLRHVLPSSYSRPALLQPARLLARRARDCDAIPPRCRHHGSRTLALPRTQEPVDRIHWDNVARDRIMPPILHTRMHPPLLINQPELQGCLSCTMNQTRIQEYEEHSTTFQHSIKCKTPLAAAKMVVLMTMDIAYLKLFDVQW